MSETKDLEQKVLEVDYTKYAKGYIPSSFASKFIVFIKLVNGGMGEDNISPAFHCEMLDQLLEGNQNLFVCFRGGAKCLDINTLVHTPEGLKPLEFIEVGDQVLDRNGKPTRVKVASEIFTEKDCYKVLLSNGDSFIATHDHQHFVQRRTQDKGKKNVWREEVLTTKELIDSGVCYKRKVSDRNPTGKEVKWRIPVNSSVLNYQKRPVCIDPYTLGLMLGDGNFERSSLCGAKEDMEELRNYIPYEIPYETFDKRNPNVVSFRIKDMRSLIRIYTKDFSMTKHNKYIPSDFVENCTETRIGVLQGLMDSDGTVYKDGRLSFSNMSYALCRSVLDIVISLGGKGRISTSTVNNTDYHRTSFYLPDEFEPFKLKRKLTRWLNNKRKVLFSEGIEDITPVDKIPTKCISVESETESYIIENGYITHNTSVIHEYMFLYLACYGGIDGFEDVNVAMYVADTIDNGIKSMRQNLQYRWEHSQFLQKYVPEAKFTDVRWEFTNADGKKLCIRGFGASPLALDEVVHTPKGTVTIADVQVGDNIYGSNGKLCTVEVKSEVFNKDMYKITLRDGRSLKVSNDHLNSVYIKKNNKFVKEVITTEELIKYPIKLTGKNEYKLAVPMCCPIEFEERLLSVDPYTLGLMLGDGRSRADGSNCLTGCLEDLKFYEKHIPYPLGVVYEDKRFSGVGSLSIKEIYRDLRKVNLQGCTTYDKFIPDEYKTASVKQRLEVVKGLMDTDGTIYGSSRISFTNTSYRLINDLKEIIESLGGYTSLKINPANVREFRGYSSNCKQSYTLSIFINVNVFKIPRKANKFKQKSLYDKLAITSIEKIKSVPSQCIGIDNENHEFVSTNYFVTHNTGVRGFKEYGKRPTWLGLDDLMSDKNAESPTIVEDIKKVLYRAARQCLDPQKRMTNWTGTPFNKQDPLYEAASGKAWQTKVFPLCQKFPCSEEEFVGAWPDRFSYEFVKNEYESLKESGEVAAFDQELMLRITSDEDRLVDDSDIVWYDLSLVLKNRSSYNFYITTDFATSDKATADFSVISVWAYSNSGDWLLVDGICKRQMMDDNVKDLFRLVALYRPLEVGIEVSGQQGGFIPWIKKEMLQNNTIFSIASEPGQKKEGFRPQAKKIVRFLTFLPTIKAKKVWFPKEMKKHPWMVEATDELKYVTRRGFKSKHDDVSDTMSMLSLFDAVKPSAVLETTYTETVDGNYAEWEGEEDMDSMGQSTVF